ncbi:MAG TPA: nuclear transport factor 2 family protein [Acidimicrobiales bacterium]|nr:nuclear transport factor 2 family protein [Acidimicrobiales bacterium]
MTAVVGAGVLAERIIERMQAGDFDGLVALYRADVVFDANVPSWRYQLQGREAVAEQFREELAPTAGGARVSALRWHAIDAGVVVEDEVRFTDAGGEERLWREVHLFHTDGEAVTEHVVYCTGVWDAATIARHAVEAPMVRR